VGIQITRHFQSAEKNLVFVIPPHYSGSTPAEAKGDGAAKAPAAKPAVEVR